MARYRFCSFYSAIGRLWKKLDFHRKSALPKNILPKGVIFLSFQRIIGK